MELNAEKVKKALEIHTGILDMPCEECPYNCDAHDEICLDVLAADALALINSQEQRIGELAKENERLTRLANLRQRDLDNANDLLFKAEDEIERLRADTVREMQERLEKRIASVEYRANTERKTVKKEELIEQVNWVLHKVVPDTIDQIAKEMLEGDE